MKPNSILITCKQMQVELPRHRSALEAAGLGLLAPELTAQQFSSNELSPMMGNVIGIIAGDDELDRAFFENSPDLRVLVRWGVGMDSVDHEAALEHGVTVRNTPGVFGREVADLAFGYVLSLARGICEVDKAVRRGDWPKFEGVTLAGQTIGIVGFGVIGREVAVRARAFGMHVIAYDPYAEAAEQSASVDFVPLKDLAERSRFLVLTCPLTEDTRHLVDSSFFGQMQPDAFLINVARGPVVKEEALVEALTSGRIAGAALDVFEDEPLPSSSPLRALPRVILGSHNGSNTREGVARASEKAIEILLHELEQKWHQEQ